MRIVYFGNNRLGWLVLEWLRRQGEELVGLVLHPPERRRWGAELLAAAGLPSDRVFDGSRLQDPDAVRRIRALRPDLGISVLFGHMLRPEVLDVFPLGGVNLHPSLLPYNRGAYPNVWSIVERTPAGVTLHHIDAGLDTGDVIAQREVIVEPIDTGERLYGRLEATALALFQETWPAIRNGTAPRVAQAPGGGTRHRLSDVQKIDCIDLGRSYTGRELIDLLRARTFPPYAGAYFWSDGHKVRIRVQLEYDDAVTESDHGPGE